MANQIANGEKSLVFMGRSPINANSPIRGYLRPPILALEHVLWNHPLVDLVYTDEYNTTKTCSRCHVNKVVIRPGTRNVFCAQCPGDPDFFLPEPRLYRTKFAGKWIPNRMVGQQENQLMSFSSDRDINAARNIKMLGIAKITGNPIPPAYIRPPPPLWLQQRNLPQGE